MDREQWYRLRNDRIKRVDEVNLEYVNKASVGVIINPFYLHHYSMQVLTFMSLNMLSRWCPSFTIDIPENIQCILPGFGNRTLVEVVSELIKSNDPFGEFNFHSITPSEFDIILFIGESNQANCSNGIWVDAEGWLAGYGKKKQCFIKTRDSNNKNPVGPSFAACLGIAEIFKRYLGLQIRGSFIQWYSIYNLKSGSCPETLYNPQIPQLLDIGNLYQIGCGAVGSSLDLLFSLLNIKGRIHLIDYDEVSIPNTASSMLFTAKDGIEEKSKVDLCFHILEKSNKFQPIPHKCDYGTFVEKHDILKNYPNIILCLANERNVWSTIQHNYPPLVLHATTTANWGINLGRHLPFQDWCIVCRFGIDNYETVPVCSQVEINTGEQEEDILGILPFLSNAGAILLLSEIIKSRNEEYNLSKANFTQFSMKPCNTSGFVSLEMKKSKKCPVCSNQTNEEYLFLLNQI